MPSSEPTPSPSERVAPRPTGATGATGAAGATVGGAGVGTPPARFGRVVTAMATPFGAGGGLDVDGAVVLARWLVEHGSDGLVVTGTTGEGPALDDAERVELWSAVAGAVEVPVLAGSTSNDTRHSVDLTARAAETGVEGILAVTPYYNRPSQAGIEAHFRAVASASELPVVLYDIPVRTGRRIARETLLRLASEVETIVAVKDAGGDPAGTARLLAEAPDGFECYSGDDSLTLPLLAVGAGGVISVASHWCGSEMAEMIARFLAGDVAGATRVNAALIPSYVYETGDEAPNPLPTKAMLRVLGLPAGECRLPMGDAPGWLEERAKSVLADLESWRSARPAPSSGPAPPSAPAPSSG
jgi:4-hydroxy-tetrahydrodipicolinate synthase